MGRLGAVAGTALLLLTSNDTFEAIVPALVAGSCLLLLLLQPRLTARMTHAGDERSLLLTGLLFSGAYAALVGSRLGAKLARRISGDALRVAIALVGLVVAALLAWRAFG